MGGFRIIKKSDPPKMIPNKFRELGIVVLFHTFSMLFVHIAILYIHPKKHGSSQKRGSFFVWAVLNDEQMSNG